MCSGEFHEAGTLAAPAVPWTTCAHGSQQSRRIDWRRWVTPPVLIVADKIIAENAHQVVFVRRKPLYEDVVILPWRKAA